METKDSKRMNRRAFLKALGDGSARLGGGLRNRRYGRCVGRMRTETPRRYRSSPRRSSHRQDDLPDQSAHRRPGIAAGLRAGMRWPTRPRSDGKGDEVDQETVNELVDYAIGHGVNYFDTSPVYVQGLSERSTGIALSRHPRDKYFLATKLSNFSNYTRENSLAMYRRSLEELQTDYFDYYLLHSVGGGTGIPLVRARYFDNGMMDFLLREREAGART